LKKVLNIILLIVSFIFFDSSVFAEGASEDKPLLQVPIFSDSHMCGEPKILNGFAMCSEGYNYKNNDNHLPMVMQQYKELAPDYEAYAAIGDLVDRGMEDQYELFMGVISKLENSGAERLFAIGNHEYFRYMYDKNASFEKMKNLFLEKTNQSSLYYDKWIKDYHFIVLGSEGLIENEDYDKNFDSLKDKYNPDAAYISDEQYAWFEKTIQEKAEEDKPIFVFLHQPIDHTVYGSDEYSQKMEMDGRLASILRKYPQSILFSGHSHYSLDHPRSVYQEGFTMVNTSSINYGYYGISPIINDFSQGWLMNVYRDRVELKARDFVKNKWIETYDLHYPITSENSLPQDHKAPYFPEGSTVDVVDVQGQQLTFEWDEALDDGGIIDKYQILLDGKPIEDLFPRYWEKKKDVKMVGKTSNFISRGHHTFEIVGYDAFGNRTSNSLKVSADTEQTTGWKSLVNGHFDYYKVYINPKSFEKQVGWLYLDDKKYHFDNGGRMDIGWIEVNGTKYYMNDDGTMHIGFLKGKYDTFYFSETGEMKSGWISTDGKWYYFNESGVMLKGWIEKNNDWYYLNQAGEMETGWLKEKDNWYYLDVTGEMVTGWIEDEGKRYYLKDSGEMTTGWLKEDSYWYLFGDNGEMKTGWIDVNGQRYFMNESGRMKTGWVKDQEKWYYLKENGVTYTGWLKEGFNWYFMDQRGEMKVGWVYDGTWFYMDDSGKMVTGWLKNRDKWYYLKENGTITTGWREINDDWYLFNQSGEMKTGWVLDGGKWYYLNDDGVWEREREYKKESYSNIKSANE
jgi:glucan-binding YG repeat protein